MVRCNSALSGTAEGDLCSTPNSQVRLSSSLL